MTILTFDGKEVAQVRMAIQQRQKVTIKYAYTIYIVQSISSGQPVLKVCNEQALRILVTQIFYQQKP